jgi:hypothetical protein
VSGRAYGRLFLGLTAAGAVWLAWPHGPAAQEAAAQSNRDGAHRYVGVAGCAAAACHGGNGPPGTRGSEYSTWAGYDRHPNAFAVLYEERSDRMARALKRDPKAKAITTEECLKCHATNEGRTQGQGDRFVLADGVGCESCHGPAGDWVTTHYLPGFRDRPAAEKERLGLRNTKDLTARAQLCTECHVGSGDRDVNHDLIAAGHPRLNFEFASFHAIYPKHWSERPELQRYPDLHARLWEIGQVVTAKASLELLAVRAKGAEDNKKPWPEFAEYACYACHKDLQVDNPSQAARFPARRPGDFPWGTWYLSMARVYADQPGGPGKSFTARLDKLRGLMQRPGPDAPAVAREAEAVAKVLDGWAGRIARERPLDAGQLRTLMRAFAAQGAESAEKLDWDQAAQLYLALAALNQALSDPPTRRAPATDQLWVMRRPLQGAFPKGYNSPQLFDAKAKADLGRQLQEIRTLLAPE